MLGTSRRFKELWKKMMHGEKGLGCGFPMDREKPLGGRILKRLLIFKRERGKERRKKGLGHGLQKRKKKCLLIFGEKGMGCAFYFEQGREEE